MRTFQHVRLHAHKGLNGGTLQDLQKINIICGPNNSGKTTVLECLANPKLCVAGLSFSADETTSVANSGGGMRTGTWTRSLCNWWKGQ